MSFLTRVKHFLCVTSVIPRVSLLKQSGGDLSLSGLQIKGHGVVWCPHITVITPLHRAAAGKLCLTRSLDDLKNITDYLDKQIFFFFLLKLEIVVYFVG